MDLAITSPSELFLETKGMRGERYAYSEISRPQYIKYRPTNTQSEVVVGGGNTITWNLPQIAGRGIYCPADCGNHMLIFDMQIAGGNASRVNVDPWRFFNNMTLKSNQTVLNEGDNLRQYTALAELVDQSPEYLAQFASAGIAPTASLASSPFVFAIPDGNAAGSAGALSRAGQAILPSGAPANISRPGIYLCNNPRLYRVAIPLSLLTSGILADRDSIYPLAVGSEITLTTHSTAKLPIQLVNYGAGGAWVNPGGNFAAPTITLKNFQLALQTVDLYGAARAKMMARLAENRYFFRTIVDKTNTVQVPMPAAKVASEITVNIAPLNYSLYGLECWFVNSEAEGALLTDKKLLPDEGVCRYQFILGSMVHPPLDVECGYLTNDASAINQIDGYSLYQTYARQKAAYEKQWYNQVQTCVSPTTYDGTNQRTGAGLVGEPQVAFYPVEGGGDADNTQILAPTVDGVDGAASTAGMGRALKFNRMFKMVLPLASVDSSDQDFISGFQGNFLSLKMAFNGNRSFYLPDSGITRATGVRNAAVGWIAPSGLTLCCRARVSSLVLMGNTFAAKFEQSNPALAL